MFSVKFDRSGLPAINPTTMQSISNPAVFCGGDLAGCSETTVESVNDGKTAAWYMHCFLQVLNITIKYFRNQSPHTGIFFL